MKIPYFDAHCDTVSRGSYHNWALRENPGHIDLQRARALGRYAQFFALFGEVNEVPEGQMWNVCCALHGRLLDELDKNSAIAALCRTGEEIDAAVSGGKTAAVLSIESADLLDCRIDRIETVAEWGTRFMNLTWNDPNAISGTNCREKDRGLSAHGKEFVRELEAKDMYVDVSHLSDPGFWDLVHMARRPIVASHSNARALCSHSRNLTDDMFRAIRDSGGVVGLNFYRTFVGGSGDMDALIAHMEHFLALDGEKTVCFGGDMDGCNPLVEGLEGLQSVPKLYEALRCRGYSETLLEDIFWNNLRRLL